MALDINDRIRSLEAIDGTIPGVNVQDRSNDRIQRVPRKWSDPVRAGVSYFRIPDARMPRGRITLLENGQNALERVMYRDYTLLRQYGGYHGGSHPADWQRTDVYYGIILDGGLHEFDAEQIIDMQWHYRPGQNATQSHRLIWAEIDKLIDQGTAEAEAVVTVIPQVAGRDLTIQTCEACGPTRRFRDAESVRQHRAIMHKADVQTMGTREAIVQAIQSGGGNGSNDALLTLLAQQGELIAQMQAKLDALEGAPRRGRPPKQPTDTDE